MGRHRIICLGLVSLACGLFPSTVPAVSTVDSEPVEAAFKLPGNHGYSISVVAFSGGAGRRGTIEFFVSRHNEAVSYRATASVTADAIRADLGNIGKVDVVRRPSGREKTVHLKCVRGTQTYEPGTYEGVVEFNGEEGYTQAKQHRVAQLPALLLFAGRGSCNGSGYGEASSPDEPGARLRGASFAHGRDLSFQVNKNGPRARTVFTASLKERRGGIRIDRELSGIAPPGAFRFDPQLQTAALSPQAPFSGSALLSRSKDSFSPIWTGNLKLDFPGRSAVPLAGPSVHTSLVHARFTRSNDSNVEIGF